MAKTSFPNIQIDGSTLKVGGAIYALRNIVAVKKQTKKERIDMLPVYSIGFCGLSVAYFFINRDTLFTLDMPKNLSTEIGIGSGSLLLLALIIGWPRKYHYLKLNVGADKEIDLVRTKSENFVTQARDEIANAIREFSVNVHFRPSDDDNS